MPQLYAVIGSAGFGRQRDKWIVAAYADEIKARRHADLARRWYVNHEPPDDCEDWCWWGKHANPYELSMRVGDGPPEGQVQCLDLREELPVEAA